MTTLVPTFGSPDDLALLLRVFLGFSLVIHGYPKLTGGWRQASQWMQSMKVPGSAAIFATIIEFFGGILLVVGFLVPAVAALVAIQFASIIGMKKSKMEASYAKPGEKVTYEIDAFYLILAVALVVLGAGAASIDSMLGIS